MRFGTEPGLSTRLDRKGRLYQRVAGIVDRVPWVSAPAPYNVTVCDHPPFVWYRVAKVGTRTIHGQLSGRLELRIDQAFQVRLPRMAHRDHFHFAFVRNPWDRLVSCWQSKVLAKDHFDLGPERDRLRSFPAFVDYVATFDLDRCDPHVRRQVTLIELDRLDFLGRFERFGDDFTSVCRHLGLTQSFDHRNKTTHDHYSAYYDDRTIEKVRRLYEPDIRLFSYQFEASGG